MWDSWRKLWKSSKESKHRKNTTTAKYKKGPRNCKIGTYIQKQKKYLAKDRELLFDLAEDHLQHTSKIKNKLA